MDKQRLNQLIAALNQYSNDSPQDQQLTQMIIEACSHPVPSAKWGKAMNRLFIEIQRLPELYQSTHPNYLDALNRTWYWLSQNLLNFQPGTPSIQKSLLKWINCYLYWRIRDLYSPDRCADFSLDAPREDGTKPGDKVADLTLSGLDALIEQEQQREIERIGLTKKRYVERDPQGKLQSCHPKGKPHCNCQKLAENLVLKDPPSSYAELERQLNVSRGTIQSHWTRKCLPLLQTTDS